MLETFFLAFYTKLYSYKKTKTVKINIPILKYPHIDLTGMHSIIYRLHPKT